MVKKWQPNEIISLEFRQRGIKKWYLLIFKIYSENNETKGTEYVNNKLNVKLLLTPLKYKVKLIEIKWMKNSIGNMIF